MTGIRLRRDACEHCILVLSYLTDTPWVELREPERDDFEMGFPRLGCSQFPFQLSSFGLRATTFGREPSDSDAGAL